MHFIKVYCSTLLVFLVADFTWILTVASNAYSQQVSALIRRSGDAMAPVWWAAFLVYFLLVLGIVIFVIPRAVGYGTYTLTNYALLSEWTLSLVGVDILGGILVCLVTGGAAVTLDQFFN